MPNSPLAIASDRISLRDRKRTATSIASTLLLSLILTAPAQGQIVPDSSLPNNSVVMPQGNRFTIEGGTTAGRNLFHSFQEFGVPTGSEAFFNNATTINNIITRVTGGNISNIDGLIRANGGAHLFLLNPNGIVFGPNARLDIGGSFFGTTANSIIFENGVEFSATDTQASPLLTVKVPIGLQYGSNPGAIQVRGDGHQLVSRHPIFAPINNPSTSDSGLQVKPGQTIALLGGDIELIGGEIAVTSGHIQLGSATSGVVQLRSENTGWSFNYDGVENFGKIDLSQQSLLDASGSLGGGSIQLSADTVRLTGGSLAWIQNQSPQASGEIRVLARDALFISDFRSDINIASGLFNETVGLGAGGNIAVATGQLTIAEGGSIATRTFGSAPSGDVAIDASQSINLIGFGFPDNSIRTSLISLALGAGDGGEITLSTGQLTLVDEALLSTSTFGTGDSGDLTVNATGSVELLGSISASNADPVISTSTFNQGDASSIVVNTPQIRLLDGGAISSSSFASGTAGTIEINASEHIQISGRSLVTKDPSEVRTINEMFQDPVLRPIFGLSDLLPDGEAGSIILRTPHLQVTDGGQIAVSNLGTGDAGDLQIQANSILLDNQSILSASTLFGEGGNINLRLAENLQMRGDSLISAEAGGRGNGGNIAINSETIALLENSTMTANAFEGNGGNIQITTQGIFLSANSFITASSQFGVDGIVEITNPDTDSATGIIELEDNPLEASDRIVAGCALAVENSFVVTGRGGLPPSPLRQLISNRPWVDLRDSSPFESESTASSLQENIPTKLVEANGWIVGPDGGIELVAFAGHQQTQQLSSLNCGAR